MDFFNHFPESSEIAKAYKEYDWANSPLGCPETWPNSLRTVVELILNTQFPMFIIWGPERILLYNDSYVPILGNKHPDAFGQPFEVVWNESWERAKPLFEETYRGKGRFFENVKYEYDYNGRHKEGYFTFNFCPLRDHDGAVKGVLCNCFETTKEVLAQKAEKVATARLGDVFLQAPLPMVILEGPKHRFVLANEPYERMVGRKVIGKTVLEAFTEEEVGHYVPLLDGVYRTGIPYQGYELPLAVPDYTGIVENRFLNVGYHPFRDDLGRIAGIFAIHQDVTDQVKLRKYIEESRIAGEVERVNFRNLFQQTPEMVCILSGPEHRFVFVNEAHVKVLGFDATGKTVREAQPESVEVRGILDEVYRTGKTAELLEIPVTVTNRLRYFNLTYAARRSDEGQIDGIMILGTEVTDQVLNREVLKHAKEEAERANDLKSAFLANMSHEIRTPLGAMLGFADLLLEPDLTEKQRAEYLGILKRNGENLSVIIDDILDLSKVEAGHMSLEYSKLDPRRLVEEVFSLLSVKALERDIRLRQEYDGSVPRTLVTDSIRVRQILLNIVGNAVKFTQHGEIVVKVSASKSKLERRILQIDVNDTGIGIPESQREHIFEMFVQADGSMTRKFGGTGLGLALSRKIARALGGDVVLGESMPHVRTRFTITLEDRNGVNVVAQRSDRGSNGKVSDSLEGISVLIVDDSQDNRALIGSMLKIHKVATDTAENGSEGYKKALNGEYDLVLMDIQMPDMDGYTTTKKLRAAGYKKPIIALSAHAMSEVREKCINVGYTDYLPKPINRNELMAAVVKSVGVHDSA